MATDRARLKSPVPTWIRRGLTITANAGEPPCSDQVHNTTIASGHPDSVTAQLCGVPPLRGVATVAALTTVGVIVGQIIRMGFQVNILAH
jgi:hypothetical protein